MAKNKDFSFAALESKVNVSTLPSRFRLDAFAESTTDISS
jgi:hypothetical protein